MGERSAAVTGGSSSSSSMWLARRRVRSGARDAHAERRRSHMAALVLTAIRVVLSGGLSMLSASARQWALVLASTVLCLLACPAVEAVSNKTISASISVLSGRTFRCGSARRASSGRCGAFGACGRPRAPPQFKTAPAARAEGGSGGRWMGAAGAPTRVLRAPLCRPHRHKQPACPSCVQMRTHAGSGRRRLPARCGREQRAVGAPQVLLVVSRTERPRSPPPSRYTLCPGLRARLCAAWHVRLCSPSHCCLPGGAGCAAGLGREGDSRRRLPGEPPACPRSSSSCSGGTCCRAVACQRAGALHPLPPSTKLGFAHRRRNGSTWWHL